MFSSIIEYGIMLEILPTKHNIKVTDNAIVAPAKKCVILSIPTFSISFWIILLILIIFYLALFKPYQIILQFRRPISYFLYCSCTNGRYIEIWRIIQNSS